MVSETEELTALYRQYFVLVRVRATEILRGDKATAEDVAQEVFIKFMQYRKKHPIEGSPAGLLYCITHRVCIDRMRKIYRHAAAVEKLEQRRVNLPSNEEDKIAISQAAKMMREEEARIGAAFYLEDLDLPDIAQAMQMSERTASRRLNRFRAVMRKLLIGSDDSQGETPNV